MTLNLKHILIVLLILTAGLVFLIPVTAFATLDLPWFSYTGTWEYDPDNHALTTYFNGLTTIRYADGSFDSSTGDGYDIIRNGVILLGEDNGSGGGVIYNKVQNSNADNLLFGSSVGGTGNIAFSVSEGGTDYIIGEFYNPKFLVTIDGIGTRLNPSFDEDNLDILWTNDGVVSDFLDDIRAYGPPATSGAWGNLGMEFTCAYGDCAKNNFNDLSPTVLTGGTFYGGKFSVVPEPVSSFLFLIGGPALVFRRYMRNGL